jgi:hypothetical protein
MASPQQRTRPKIERRSSLFELLQGSLEDEQLDTVDASTFGTIQRPSRVTPKKQKREQEVDSMLKPSPSPLRRSLRKAEPTPADLVILRPPSPPPSPTEDSDDQSEVRPYLLKTQRRPTLSRKAGYELKLQESPYDKTSAAPQVVAKAHAPPPNLPPPSPLSAAHPSSPSQPPAQPQPQQPTPRNWRATRLVLRLPKPPHPWEPKIRSKLRCVMSVDDYDDEGNIVENFPMLAEYRPRKRAETAGLVRSSAKIG